MDTLDLTNANDLITQKKFDEAKSELELVLKKDTNNAEALKLLGLCKVNLEQFDSARADFETVVKYKADDATSWFYLALCYDNLEDFLHARTAYLEVIKLREDYVEAYKNLAIVYMRFKKTQEAIDLAKSALEKFEDARNDYTFPYIVGTAYLSIKQFEKAGPYFEQAHALNPEHSQIVNNLGTVYLTLKNYEKAYEYYVKASELDPKNSITYYNIGSILQIKGDLRKACTYYQKAYDVEPSEHYLVALALVEFKSGLYEAAAKTYQKLVAQHPEKHNFQYNLACCYEMLGELNFAVGILSQLVLLNPKSIIMSQKLASLYLRINQPQKAKEIYSQMLNRGMVSADIYYEYAMVCVATQDLDMAEKVLKKVITVKPDFATAHKDLGVIYLNKRLFDYSQDEFKQALELEPENPEIIFEYANFLHATADFSSADEYYRHALKLLPDSSRVLIFFAMNLLEMNKVEDAHEISEKLLKMLPEDAFVLFLAGKIEFLEKHYDEAQMLLIRSVEQKQAPEAMNLLALNYLEQQDFDKANNLFLNLLKDNKQNTNLLISSTKCYVGLKDFKSANKMVNKVLKIFPESFEGKELKKVIKSELKKIKEN